MPRSLLSPGPHVPLLLLLCLSPVGAHTARAAEEAPPAAGSEALLHPEQAVALALQLHPGVLEARAVLERAQGQAGQVALLPGDPRLAARYALDGSRGGANLLQPVSITGQGVAARHGARAQVQAAQEGLARARRVAAAELRGVYVDAVVAVGQARIAATGHALTARLRDAVGQQVDRGDAALLDLRLAQMALVQAGARLLAAQEAEARALRLLAALTGRAVGPEALSSDAAAVVPPSSGTGASERTDLAQARLHLAAVEAELRQQRAATLAPISVGAFIENEDGETFVGPAMQLTLPLFQRNQSGRAAARGAVGVAAGAAAALTAQVQTEQETAQQRVGVAGLVADSLRRDPVEDAREALVAIDAGYAAGEMDLPRTLLLQNEVLVGQAAAVELEGAMAHAQLDLLLAMDDPSLLGGG